MIYLAIEQVEILKVYQELPQVLIQKYLDTLDSNYDFMEARYLLNLKNSVK